MRIVKLTAENVKRLRAVEITPKGDMVVISGKNGAGKSSVLDSIMYALGGKSTHCKEPVRKGATKATVELDLGDLMVTRTFTSAGGGQVVVRGKEGAAVGSPQTILDKLADKVGFDPLAFARMTPKQQAETLKRVLGLDLDDLVAEAAATYEKRTEINREARSLEARMSTMRHYSDLENAKEEALSDLLEELRVANEEVTNRAILENKAVAAGSAVEALVDRAQATQDETVRLERELAATREKIRDLITEKSRAREYLEAIEAQVKALPKIDTQEIADRINTAEATNAKIAANRERETVYRDLQSKKRAADKLTQALEEIEEEKRARIAKAKMPVEGLSFSADGELELNGVPFDQASQAEQLRLSVAVGMAMNPELRVLLIRDGSLLDSASMDILEKMASAADFQVWLERVEDDAHSTVVIEDGRVAE